eukprot:Platyproteum_vivax@DN4961_c0_g1_i2.p1
MLLIWDISDEVKGLCGSGTSHTGTQLRPTIALNEAHVGTVEDVKFHFQKNEVLGSVGDDKMLKLWDLRQKGEACRGVCGGGGELNCLAFNSFFESLIATGSSDGSVCLWDARKMTAPFHTIAYHTGDVLGVEFMPQNPSVLASSSVDSKVCVYDLAKIEENMSPQLGRLNCPELLFVHCGHTGSVNDFHWNPLEPWVIASVADDRIFQMWKIADTVYPEVQEALKH